MILFLEYILNVCTVVSLHCLDPRLRCYCIIPGLLQWHPTWSPHLPLASYNLLFAKQPFVIVQCNYM